MNRKKVMGGYGYGKKKKMYGGSRMKAQSGNGKFRARNKKTGAIRTFDTQEAYNDFLLNSDEGADFIAMGRESGEAKKPAAKKSTPKSSGYKPDGMKQSNSSERVKAEGKKVSRTPKEGMFYLKDEQGNFVFYPKGKFNDASMRTAAERALPGSAGKVSQGTVDDIFMDERPDQMKKMKTKKPPKIDVKRDDDIIMKSKEVKFDAPSKPKADGSKDVAKSKVDAAKAKQAKKTQRATDRAAKKAKAPSMRAEKRAVRQNTRQQVQDIKREGRQERKAIRRGMAQAGLSSSKAAPALGSSLRKARGNQPLQIQAISQQRSQIAPPELTRKDRRKIKRTTKKVDKIMKKAQAGLKDAPEGNKGKGLRNLSKEVRNKMGFKKNGGKRGKMKDRRR